MWFLPPAGRHRAGHRRILGGVPWCRAVACRTRADEPHAVGLPVSRCSPGEARERVRIATSPPDVPPRVDASRRLACAAQPAQASRRHSDPLTPATRGEQPVRGHLDPNPVKPRYPRRCLRRAEETSWHTPTPPRAVGSRATGAGAPSSRARASARARRVRDCGEKRARLDASLERLEHGTRHFFPRARHDERAR